MKKYKISASILSADFSKLAKDIKSVQKYVDEFHLDIMDGHYVPNISFGPDIVKFVRDNTKIPLDVHLMISEPEKYVEKFADAGSDTITIPSDIVCYHPCMNILKGLDVKMGIAFNPDKVFYHSSCKDKCLLDEEIDRVILMSVYPGFGGQKFIESSLEKIAQVREYLDKWGHGAEISVDGGITADNVYDVAKNGANVFVSGSSIFKGNKRKNVKSLRKAIEKYYK
ncbi:MAG: ribulose-phosphate 3-epimerase [Nanoarchaeota archaeon]|nr:ribulose-phosphate 3-epimerase [Nanoarchaeota archaeon]